VLAVKVEELAAQARESAKAVWARMKQEPPSQP